MTYRASFSWMIIYILAIGLVFLPQGNSAEAAGTFKFVSVNNTVVKEKPYSYGKKVGTLKSGTRVTVYNDTKNGWSEIRYKNKKAYVFSRHVHISYHWNPSKVYGYEHIESGDFWIYKYLRKSNNGWDLWQEDGSGGVTNFFMNEDHKGIHYAYSGSTSGAYSTELQYPLKVGKKWRMKDEDGYHTLTILSVTKTITTPAGTFKRVIAVKEGDYVYYYAPNVGRILITINGYRMNQLISIKNK